MTNPSARLDNTAQCSYNNIAVYKPVCWNWQTRRTQNPLVVTPYGFDPHHRHKNNPLDRVPVKGIIFIPGAEGSNSTAARRRQTKPLRGFV